MKTHTKLILKYSTLTLVILGGLYYLVPIVINNIGAYFSNLNFEKRITSRQGLPSFTYYISSQGNDQNDGKSLETAWKTIQKINETEFNPGDSILLEGSSIFVGNIEFDKNDVGLPERPITIRSFGDGRATIDGNMGDGIKIINTQGYQISNINIRGKGYDLNNGSGIAVINDMFGDRKLDYITIDSMDVSGFGYWGILIDGNKNKSGFKNVSIEYCDVHENGDAGLYVYGEFNLFSSEYAHSNVKITNIKSFDNPGRSESTTNTGSGIVISDTDSGLIEKCIAYNNGFLCHAEMGGPVGIWAWDSNNIVIQHNESYDNKTASSKDGGGFDLDGGMTNSILQYNYSHDNDGAGLFLAQFTFARKHRNNIVRYNVSYNDGKKNNYGGIEVWGICEQSIIHNNTVIFCQSSDTGSAAFILRPNDELGDSNKKLPTNITITNNIFISNGNTNLVSAIDALPTIKFIGNNYFNINGNTNFLWNLKSYKSLSEWREETYQETMTSKNYGFSIDPELNYKDTFGILNNQFRKINVNHFMLKPNSPMIDAALHMNPNLTQSKALTDIKGIPIPQSTKADIGAHEFKGNK